MQIEVFSTKSEAGSAAAERGAAILKTALAEERPGPRGANAPVRFIAATGASQFEMLERLTAVSGIDWLRTEMFHLDEYVGIAADHPASFRRYLSERLVGRVHPGAVHLIEGDSGDPAGEARRLGRLISEAPVEVAFVGIGENGHLAFNDPPADFETDEPYLVMRLDDACRMQQVGEGWFASLGEVPERAISMSIRQIMKARAIVCTVPDRRKAKAVRACLAEDAPVTPLHPASILKRHPNAFIFLDRDSAALL